MYKNGKKTIVKFGDIEIEKQNFHQHKRPILIKIQVLIKQQYLKRSPLVKMILNISLATKMLKTLDLYVYFSQKQVHMEETLIKLDICLS